MPILIFKQTMALHLSALLVGSNSSVASSLAWKIINLLPEQQACCSGIACEGGARVKCVGGLVESGLVLKNSKIL